MWVIVGMHRKRVKEERKILRRRTKVRVERMLHIPVERVKGAF